MRSLKVSPSLILFLIFCAFLGWNFSQSPLPDPAPRPPPSKPEEKKPSRIALVTFVTEQRSYLYLSLRSKDHYTRRHGLDFIVDYEAHSERGVTWWKYSMMERLIKKNKWDWLWWLDFDTIITNTDIKLADIIEDTLKNVTNRDDIDYLVTHDCNGLNAGSFIVRSHDRSIKFLQDIYAIQDREKKAGNDLSEQDAMAKLIQDDPASGNRTVQVPQWKLNAFPKEIACFDDSDKAWEPGTFTLHFAGAWAHVKGDDPTGQLMRKYEPEIIWGEGKDFY